MKSTSHAGLFLVLVMIIIVLGSLFWFLYSDYDATRQQADMANSRATRATAMEQEAGQLRTEADQIEATRTALEMELATAVFTQNTLEQELVNDQQVIEELETQLTQEAPNTNPPQLLIKIAEEQDSYNLSEPVNLTVTATDPAGISAINIIFNNNPPLEIPMGGETIVSHQEQWPLSEAGAHTAVVTAVNSNNISSQAQQITITVEAKRTSQQIINEVANIIGLPDPTPESVETQVSAEPSDQAPLTPIILQAFDFNMPSTEEPRPTWGQYCEPTPLQSANINSQEIIDLPAQELNLVKAQVHDWQETRFQFSQLLAKAPNDDARAALCALSAGHARWVMETYISKFPPDEQASFAQILTPEIGLDNNDVLAAQQTFGTAYGSQFINKLIETSGKTAVTTIWNQPPTTTAQILTPSAYEANSQATPITLPDLTAYLGDSWQPVTTNVLGAFMLGQYLENYVKPTVAETAVSGWQGDQYTIYQQNETGDLLLAHQLAWATEQEAQEFATAYEEYVNGRFANNLTTPQSPENSTCWTGGNTEETVCLFNNNTQTIIVKAPNYNLTVNTLEELITS